MQPYSATEGLLEGASLLQDSGLIRTGALIISDRALGGYVLLYLQ